MGETEDRSEIIAHQWVTLEALWIRCKADVDPAKHGEIDALFPKGDAVWSSNDEGWRQLNYAEQRVGAYLDATALAAEYMVLLDLARSRKVAFDTYDKKKPLFEIPPPTGTTMNWQRAVYISLLQYLQGDFIEGRRQRQLRRQTALRLSCFGVGASAIVVALLALFLEEVRKGIDAGDIGPASTLAIVASLGGLRA